MKPLDPRLLRHARAARGYVVLTTILGLCTAALVVAQATLIAAVLAPVINGDYDSAVIAQRLGLLAGVVVARAAVSWAQERFALRASSRTIAELREQMVAHAVALGPRWLASGRGPTVATLATRGLDALEPYLVRYLPQLLLAATVTPATLLVVLGQDWVSAAIIAGTIPLVPIFMILVGQLTAGTSERRLAVMQRLGAQVLDLLAGLPTLRAFGRENGPEKRVRALGEANRKATMGTLSIAFLSGMVLELLTTLSVAIVAVAIGLRLLGGSMDLQPALAILILAPEVYLPIRQVGMQFHASTDGLAAAEQAFAVLDEPIPEPGTMPCPPLSGAVIELAGLGVRAGDRGFVAPADLDLSVPIRRHSGGPGRVIALTGPSGSGKTTTAFAILGLVRPDEGSAVVRLDDQCLDIADIDLPTLWKQIAWVPQRPPIEPGTLREVILQETPATDEELAAAAALTGLNAVLETLPDGWDTRVGRGGVGLSVGQRQRVALTAAMLGDPSQVPLVVLDEPTAHLDAHGERVILDAVGAWRDQGRTVLVIAHRPSLVRIADEVVEVRARSVETKVVTA